jgi:hypothetical protein
MTSVRDKCWQRQLVAELGLFEQPWFAAVVGDRIGSADLCDVLQARPGSFILKPRYGSNGVAVVRIVSDGERLSAASDCPDTALFLDEFPADPHLHGRDVITALATQRARFLNRATAGLPEWAMQQSILEGEIQQDRAEGSLFEPRVVAQRTDGAHEEFTVLGAICKQIDTPIGAVVARDFRELSLVEALTLFLKPLVAAGELPDAVQRAETAILATGTCAVTAVAPLAAALGTRVHQIGIDGRLCWNSTLGRVEFWFLEFQFGIGRIDIEGPPLPGYETPAALRKRFGPEHG